MTRRVAPRSALYDTIETQPAVVRAGLEGWGEAAARAAKTLVGARRVYLAGTGTSSHAAIVGEYLLRLAGLEATATTNFDFVSYPRPLGPDDALIAISHRGSKRYGNRAIARAHAAGARIIGITGQDSPMEGADVVIATAPQEKSATHTASYTANLAALALIAVAAGERTGADVAPLRAALLGVPAAIETLLGHEDAVRAVAEVLATRRRLVLAGAGPNTATAREGALKIKESSYLAAEGFELETALHGALQAVEEGDVAVVIAAEGPATERTADLVRALDLIGARLLLVADERALASLPAPGDLSTTPTVVPFAPVPEVLSPILAVVPLQLLAALTAALVGTDADSFRADDPTYKRVNASYEL